jgi:hypothetical protein
MNLDLLKNVLVGLVNTNAEIDLTAVKLGDKCLIKIDTLSLQMPTKSQDQSRADTEAATELQRGANVLVASNDGSTQLITIPAGSDGREVAQAKVSEVLPYRLLPYYSFDSRHADALPYNTVLSERVRLIVPKIPEHDSTYRAETELFAKGQRLSIALDANNQITLSIGGEVRTIKIGTTCTIGNYVYKTNRLAVNTPHTIPGGGAEVFSVSQDAYDSLTHLMVSHEKFPEEHHFVATPKAIDTE